MFCTCGWWLPGLYMLRHVFIALLQAQKWTWASMRPLLLYLFCTCSLQDVWKDLAYGFVEIADSFFLPTHSMLFHSLFTYLIILRLSSYLTLFFFIARHTFVFGRRLACMCNLFGIRRLNQRSSIASSRTVRISTRTPSFSSWSICAKWAPTSLPIRRADVCSACRRSWRYSLVKRGILMAGL